MATQKTSTEDGPEKAASYKDVFAQKQADLEKRQAAAKKAKD